jgi:hypothetical protein
MPRIVIALDDPIPPRGQAVAQNADLCYTVFTTASRQGMYATGDLDVGVQRAEEAPVRGTSERTYLTELRQTLAAHFDEGELRTLCFDLGIDYDDLPGAGRANKARELVAYLDRRGRISELVRICERLRPRVSWGVPLEAAEEAPPTSPTPAPGHYRLDHEHGLRKLRDLLTGRAPGLLSEFYTLEARLLDNLRDERWYGSTETVRAERARVSHALNDLAGQAGLGLSFNDLCRR